MAHVCKEHDKALTHCLYMQLQAHMYRCEHECVCISVALTFKCVCFQSARLHELTSHSSPDMMASVSLRTAAVGSLLLQHWTSISYSRFLVFLL